MTDLTLVTVANTMGEAIKNFRSAAVTAENKATPMARSILAALLAGSASPDKVVAVTIASFGNPKSASGKPVEKLSGLRDFVGGDATRKTVETILRIFENVKDNDGLKGLAVKFALSDAAAPKSLAALDKHVKDTMRAEAAKEVAPADGEGAELKTGDATNPAPATGETLADRLNKMTLEISALDDDALQANADAITALRDAIRVRYDAYAASQLTKLAA